MSSLDPNERELVLDYCLGLTCAEEVAEVEAWIARNEEAAAFYARIQAALGLLDSLPPEPCPGELAERTIRLLGAMAQEAQEAISAKTACPRLHHYREDYWVCLSSNILMK
jgi:anti-sigma factor RsiW